MKAHRPSSIIKDIRMNKQLLGALVALLGADAVYAQQSGTVDLRDQRYCEIIIGARGSYFPRELLVYNTIGLNAWPEALWSKITVGSVKADAKANFVRLNGPRPKAAPAEGLELPGRPLDEGLSSQSRRRLCDRCAGRSARHLPEVRGQGRRRALRRCPKTIASFHETSARCCSSILDGMSLVSC